MNFEEKKITVSDSEKNTGGLPFIVLIPLLFIIAMTCIVALKSAGVVDFNFNGLNGYTTLLTYLDILMRAIGVIVLVLGMRVASRKILLYDYNVKWYRIIIFIMVGSILIICGSDVIMFYVKCLVDFYY